MPAVAAACKGCPREYICGKGSDTLQSLVKQLQVDPPSLQHIIGLIDQGECLVEFRRIVREFVPHYEHEIMSGGPSIDMFRQYFEERYFPLYEDAGDGDFENFLYRIPVDVMGLSCEQYEDLGRFSPGYLLALVLVESPYAWSEASSVPGEDYTDFPPSLSIPRPHLVDKLNDGVRVPLLESVAKLVGDELVTRIKSGGYKPEELHKLDGTPYEGIAGFADWVCGCTGTIFTDCSYSEEWENDMEWSRENVELLAEQWPIAKAINAAIDKITTWLEDSPREHFREILEALDHIPKIPNKKAQVKPRTLMEIFEQEDR